MIFANQIKHPTSHVVAQETVADKKKIPLKIETRETISSKGMFSKIKSMRFGVSEIFGLDPDLVG